MESLYDLELEKVLKEIKNTNAKSVLLQFPDGLKMYSNKVVDEIHEKTNTKCSIWFGDCFGACDIPLNIKNIDLVVQFGHNKFIKNTNGWSK
jgi:2-(3-amino-3-carboxypropyl)histidine synthase